MMGGGLGYWPPILFEGTVKVYAIIVFKRSSSNHWHDEVCVFELVRDSGLYWECQEQEIWSSHNYEKRKLLAKKLAAKYQVENIIYTDRYYPIKKTLYNQLHRLPYSLWVYRCKFYKRDLKLKFMHQ